MVFYRKYRPQKIDELDSQEIRDTLYSVFSGKSIPHAFLFTGPKGLGKTSTARIIAKIFNCEKINDYSVKKGKQELAVSSKKSEVKNIEPCNKCYQCASITNGSNIDILEIDGASNRGIDEIRDLREKIKLSPAQALKKVYIIDEVHMLTTEAFNALLKTLEEPPSHAAFILCTTEQHKVPETIASRCFRVAFKRASREELTRAFKRITTEEKIAIDDEVLPSIAKLSDGSFRDGVKILEELMTAANGKKITKEILEEKYQILSTEQHVVSLLKLLEEKDSKKSLELIGKLHKEGIEIKNFLEQLINKLHEELLVKAGVLKQEPQVKFDIKEITELIEILVKANLEIKFSPLPQLPLELAVVEWGETEQKENQKVVANNPQLQPVKQEVHSASSTSSVSSKPPAVKEEVEEKKEIKTEPVASGDFWKNLIEKVNYSNRSAAGFLRGCALVSLNNSELIIETAYKFHKDKLNELKTKSSIEQVAEDLTGDKLKLSINLKEKGR
jgi:DNA polymerase III subunit gamma/tau